jgi:hypothetical protein
MRFPQWALTAGVAVVVMMLCGAVQAAALAPEEVPSMAVPRMATPPIIDGTIDPVEWREATALSGVATPDVQLHPRPTTYFLAWDPGHLYLAYRTYIRPGYKPAIRDGRSPGMAFVFDDGAELVVKPAGKNVPVNNQQAAFKFFLNCIGYIGEQTKLDLGQQLKNWSPQFKTNARLTAPGTAPGGGRWCEVEMSSIPADFELTGAHRVGDEWRIMLGFNHIPMWMQARIPCIGGYFEATGGGYCRATLVEKTPAVQLRMEAIPNLATDGTAALQIAGYNPTATEVRLAVDVDIAGKVIKHETLTLSAGGVGTFTLAEKLPAEVKGGKASVQVSQDGRKLLTYATYFTVGTMKGFLDPVAPGDPSKFALDARYNPVRNWLLVKGDTYYLPDPAAARSMKYRVVAQGADAKTIADGTLTSISEWYFQERLALPPLKPGTYVLEASMTLADGTVLGPMRSAFTKKDEAQAYPEWWGKKFGNVERVLPPFTALVRKGATVTCWGREYTLNALGLPAAIHSQRTPILAAPARLVVVAGGKETLVPLTSAPAFTDTTDWRVRFTGKTSGGGLDFRASGWLEQDGLVYVELTYGPSGKAPVTVDALRIEYPLSEADADCLTCIGPGANFSSKTTMVLPPKKAGDGATAPSRLWSTLDTGKSGCGMTVGTFYPTVWIGNERRGLVWWADNDQGWFPEDTVAAHDAVRQGNAVVLRNHIIGKPVALTAPRTLAFSYLATPARPFTQNWRMVGATEDGTFVQPFRGIRADSKTGQPVNPGAQQQNWIHPESRYPEEWSAIWAEQKAKADAHARHYQWSDPYSARNGVNFTHMSFALHGYGRKSILNELYDYFGPEWEGNLDTWNESYIDYAMYLFDQGLREGGVRSTYWDITFPQEFTNLLSGLSYRLPDGRIQRGYNGWNLRRFFMRLQALMVDYGLFPNAVGSHSTNAYVPVAMPWLDAVLDGERNWNLDITDLDWVDYYPIERMRAMSCPHSWGTPICWMANMDTTSAAKRDAGKRVQAMWVWMHDSWRNPYIPQAAVMPTPILDWGIASDQTVYHPYWRNPYVTCADKDVLISLWQLPDRVMLGVFNYDRKKAKDVTLKVDLNGLGLVPQKPWQEFVGVRDLWKLEEKAGPAGFDFYGQAVTIKGMQPHTVRFVGLRKY